MERIAAAPTLSKPCGTPAGTTTTSPPVASSSSSPTVNRTVPCSTMNVSS
ncbi:MAG TPA: hypothetical protein VN213_03260 [Solirubrobacteraceae bacterium]|nr:hypothetical protein [Solirubrobacteraceae bacterium]